MTELDILKRENKSLQDYVQKLEASKNRLTDLFEDKIAELTAQIEELKNGG